MGVCIPGDERQSSEAGYAQVWRHAKSDSAVCAILVQEQDHQIDLATALGEEVPNVGFGPQGRSSGKRR